MSRCGASVGEPGLRRALLSGSFRRSIPLPDEVDPAKAEARLDSGVLTVRLPKTAPKHEQSRTIPAKTS